MLRDRTAEKLIAWTREPDYLPSYAGPATYCTSCVTLGRLLNLPVPQFPYL